LDLAADTTEVIPEPGHLRALLIARPLSERLFLHFSTFVFYIIACFIHVVFIMVICLTNDEDDDDDDYYFFDPRSFYHGGKVRLLNSDVYRCCDVQNTCKKC